MNDDLGSGWATSIIIGLIIWGAFSYFHNQAEQKAVVSESAYGTAEIQSGRLECYEPENPYDDGSGHFAGWEWGAEGNYCDGNSNSFIEGCEEYEAAEEEYEICLSKQ